MKKHIGIYQIRHLDSDDSYIGSSKHITRRWGEHRYHLRRGTHFAIHLQRAWIKYGEDRFVFTTIELCDASLLEEREQHFLTTVVPTYNVCMVVGERRELPMPSREKIRQSKLGKPRSEETKQKLREARLGTKASDETKLKMSITRAGGKRTDDTKQRMSEAAMGHTVSEETREKLRQAHLGTTASDETKKKMSVARTGKKQSDDTRAKRSAAITAWWTKKRATEH